MAGVTKKPKQPKRPPNVDEKCFHLLSGIKEAIEEMTEQMGEAFKTIDKKLNIIIMKEEEAAAVLQEQTQLLIKIQGETQSLIEKVNELIKQVEELTAQMDEVSPELESAITGVKDQVAVVDALVEDIPAGATPKEGDAGESEHKPDGMG
jgi:predicted nuclease with TOPRIM domain